MLSLLLLLISSSLLISIISSHSILKRSYPSPKGYHHGKSEEYYHSIRSQPADALKDRFIEQYNKIMNKSNGYFSNDGVPYHSVETLMVEAPDYGHETTSEAFSEYIWMTALNIWATGNVQDFKAAWSKLESTLIPSESQQISNSAYDPSAPASYAPEMDTPNQYPVTIDRNVPVGKDDLADELATTYGKSRFFASHWLMDVDNIYGFGQQESLSTSDRNVLINSYQRGPNESVWRTLPQPEWELFKIGESSPHQCGFLELFIYDSQYACDKQWKYTGAPDADARTIQATYWAYVFAQNSGGDVSQEVNYAVQLSDYVRYSMFDKYFKTVPCYSVNCPAVDFNNGWNATFYLISWYMAWGGPITDTYWGFRIGSSHAHQGYQNSFTAYVLSNIPAFESKTSAGKNQWSAAYWQTLKFWNWLQSVEGPIAGGATNSWKGRYLNPASDGVTGYFLNGMAYTWEPVYHDPPSNNWFGMQAWSQERNAETYYINGEGLSKTILDKFVNWVLSLQSKILLPNNDYQVPSNLAWTGQPSNYTTDNHVNNNLHVSVSDWSKDVGVASALAHLLTFYAAKANNANAQTLARDLLDRIYMYAESKGVSVAEERQDYIGNAYGQGFWEPVWVPTQLPNGESLTFGNYPASSNGGQGGKIQNGDTFITLRPWYQNDPSWPIIQQAKQSNKAPVFYYHRMWAQAEFAIACADYSRLFGSNSTHLDQDLYMERINGNRNYYNELHKNDMIL